MIEGYSQKKRACPPRYGKRSNVESSDGKHLSDIGERKAINLIEGIIGGENIGDDCAVVEMGNQCLLITTDMVSRNTHAPSQMTPFDFGHFVVAVNLSDIAAMGGLPIGFVAAIGLPRDYPIKDFKDIIRGMDSCARKYMTELIGGDTKEALSPTIAGTAFGIADMEKILRRSGARPGDIVAVTGELGGAAAGYLALKKRKTASRSNLQRLIAPEPRVAEGLALAGCGEVTSCMDISDGLAISLYNMAESGNVGFEVDSDIVPEDALVGKIISGNTALRNECLLYFGGDYELVATIKKHGFSRARKAIESAGGSLTRIGRVLPAGKLSLLVNGRAYTLEKRGWQHFSQR